MASKSVDDEACSSSSIDSTTIGDIVAGLKGVTGEEDYEEVSDWPTNPVDSLCSLIHVLWPREWYVDIQCDEDKRRGDLWKDTMNNWWKNLPEPIQAVIIEIYNE